MDVAEKLLYTNSMILYQNDHREKFNTRYIAYNEGLGINIFFIYIEQKLDIIY